VYLEANAMGIGQGLGSLPLRNLLMKKKRHVQKLRETDKAANQWCKENVEEHIPTSGSSCHLELP
jgi:hypothetical protein